MVTNGMAQFLAAYIIGVGLLSFTTKQDNVMLIKRKPLLRMPQNSLKLIDKHFFRRRILAVTV